MVSGKKIINDKLFDSETFSLVQMQLLHHRCTQVKNLGGRDHEVFAKFLWEGLSVCVKFWGVYSNLGF
jgi:hypothetical protein